MSIELNADGRIDLVITPSNGQNTPVHHDITLIDMDLKLILDGAYDIEGWVLAALAGKANHRRKILLDEHRAKYMSDPNVNTDDEVIAAVFAKDDYKTAKQRIDEASA
tara:strand:- start:463 stop:786 length:324 start_codon:yes stop_codon:yes gene_type:complete